MGVPDPAMQVLRCRAEARENAVEGGVKRRGGEAERDARVVGEGRRECFQRSVIIKEPVASLRARVGLSRLGPIIDMPGQIRSSQAQPYLSPVIRYLSRTFLPSMQISALQSLPSRSLDRREDHTASVE